jgi:uncharacterized protein (DUF1501 family)
MSINISRRNFLQQTGVWTASAGVGFPMALNLVMPGTAQAADVADYRALVCVFLAGGNDSYATVLRTDKGLERYKAARSEISLNVDRNTPDGKALIDQTTLSAALTDHPDNASRGLPAGLGLALHPKLKFLKQHFDAGKVALIGNIGPLLKPMTAAKFVPGSPEVPLKLFSHNDQLSIWQSGKAEGSTWGWGGELVRQAAINAQTNTLRKQINGVPQPEVADNIFSAIGIESTPVFCYGTDAAMPGAHPDVAAFGATKEAGALRLGFVGPYNMDTPGPQLNMYWDRAALLGPLFAAKVGTSDGGTAGTTLDHLIESDYAAKLNNANDAWTYLSSALAEVPLVPSGRSLNQQLEMVYKMIRAHDKGQLGMHRQVFYVQLNGFDTHKGQVGDGLESHSNLLEQLDEALQRFQGLLDSTGDTSKVVTFTASEFGRKFNQNGNGTDHGWGGHHFVMGGSTRGGVWGHFPDLSSWVPPATPGTDGHYGDTQLLPDGAMVPKVPVDNLVKALGSWFGANMDDAVVASQLTPYADASPTCVLDIFQGA